MDIRAVVFDLDGTLIDTLADIAAGVNAGLKAFGLPPASQNKVRSWIGEGLPVLCRRAVGNRSDIDLDSLTEKVREYYASHVAEQAQLYPGIADVLDTLSLRQIPMAILSNKPHPIAIDTCKALLKEWKFEAIEGYKDEARRKPNPQTLLEIVTRMECQPEETVLLGDSATDMATALAGGVIPIGATWGYRSAHELRQAGACRLIDHAHQFIELL